MKKVFLTSGIVDGVTLLSAADLNAKFDQIDAAIMFNRNLVITGDGVIQERAFDLSIYYGQAAGIYFSNKTTFRYPYLSGGAYLMGINYLDTADATSPILLDNGYVVAANLNPTGAAKLTWGGYSVSPAQGQWSVCAIGLLAPGKYVVPIIWRGGIYTNPSDSNSDYRKSNGAPGAYPLARWHTKIQNRSTPVKITWGATLNSQTITLPEAPRSNRFYVMITPCNASGVTLWKNITGITRSASAPHITINTSSNSAGGEIWRVVATYD